MVLLSFAFVLPSSWWLPVLEAALFIHIRLLRAHKVVLKNPSTEQLIGVRCKKARSLSELPIVRCCKSQSHYTGDECRENMGSENPPLPWSRLFCASGHNALRTTGAPRPLQKQFSFHSFFIFHIRWSCYSWRSSLRNTQDTQSVIFPVKLSQQLLGQTSPETKINNALGCPAWFMKQKDKYGIVNITVWWQAVGVFYWLQDNDRSHSTWW